MLKIRFCINRDLCEDDPLVDITQGFYFGFREYVTDESGRHGAKFLAYGSEGYDFKYESEEFTLFPGDIYKGIWSTEEEDGPTDWYEKSYCYTVQLVETED